LQCTGNKSGSSQQLITHQEGNYAPIALHCTTDLPIPVHAQQPFLEDTMHFTEVVSSAKTTHLRGGSEEKKSYT